MSSLRTFGCPSRSSLWKTWQNFQQSTALLERGSRLTAAQKVWAPFSWWVPKMQGDRVSQGSQGKSAWHSSMALVWLLTNVTFDHLAFCFFPLSPFFFKLFVLCHSLPPLHRDVSLIHWRIILFKNQFLPFNMSLNSFFKPEFYVPTLPQVVVFFFCKKSMIPVV